MDRIKLLLDICNISFTEKDGNLHFDLCPLCKVKSKSYVVGSVGYICEECAAGSISINEFFGRLGMELDESSDDFAEQAASSLEAIFDPQVNKGITTGYSSLNKRTGGLLPGHLYILAAETGMGKSVFASNLVINAITDGNIKCSYLDLENGEKVNTKRFISIHGNMPVRMFEDPSKVTYAQQIAETLEGTLIQRDFTKLEKYIGNRSGIDMATVIGKIINQDAQNGARLFVVDPLENFEMRTDDHNAIAKVVEHFKNLAIQLNVAIIILHHIKKAERMATKMLDDISSPPPTKYRIPALGDIIGSSKITNKATDVWTIVRQKDDPVLERKGYMLLRVLKAREDRPGESGDVLFNMNLETLKIKESSPVLSSEQMAKIYRIEKTEVRL